jgi:hypothetical protein
MGSLIIGNHLTRKTRRKLTTRSRFNFKVAIVVNLSRNVFRHRMALVDSVLAPSIANPTLLTVPELRVP